MNVEIMDTSGLEIIVDRGHRQADDPPDAPLVHWISFQESGNDVTLFFNDRAALEDFLSELGHRVNKLDETPEDER